MNTALPETRDRTGVAHRSRMSKVRVCLVCAFLEGFLTVLYGHSESGIQITRVYLKTREYPGIRFSTAELLAGFEYLRVNSSGPTRQTDKTRSSITAGYSGYSNQGPTSSPILPGMTEAYSAFWLIYFLT